MDIEQLTKSQIILLTLLVSFMTSIATGIVTVALMQQAPPPVIQTINRVVRETVATVAAPITESKAQVATVVQTVVPDKEIIAQAVAVAAANPSFVRVYNGEGEGAQLLGMGVLVAATGMVAIDASVVPEGAHVTTLTAEGAWVPLHVAARNASSSLVYLAKVASSTPDTNSGTVPSSQ